MGVEAAFFVPTENGLRKSIIDAHAEIRNFLKYRNVHNFDVQGQGRLDAGVSLDVTLLNSNSAKVQKISLYRPETKHGDPRFWTNLRGFAVPNNLLAFLTDAQSNLFLLNCSDSATWAALEDVTSNLYMRLLECASVSRASESLLKLLRDIASRGWIPSTKSGDTAVGHTLETALDIKANSSKLPDYLGAIEIKAGRVGSIGKKSGINSRTKKTLLSKVPNWKISPYSAIEILKKFGSNDASGRLNLSVTVSNRPNRQGLYLLADDASGLVLGNAIAGDIHETLVVWELKALQGDLGRKHKETFWVEAESRSIAGVEEFRFIRAHRTTRPLVGNLGPLLNDGTLTMDFTLSRRPTGAVRDHGYLFRIEPRHMPLLFPDRQTFDL